MTNLEIFQKYLLDISLRMVNEIQYCSTYPKDYSLDYTTHNQMVDNMRSMVDEQINNIQMQQSLSAPQKVALRTRLLIHAMDLFKAANCEEFCIKAYDLIRQDYHQQITDKTMLIRLFAIKDKHQQVNHVILKCFYESTHFYCDIQNCLIMTDKSQIQVLKRDGRRVYVLADISSEYQLESIHRGYDWTISNELSQAFDEASKEITQQYQQWSQVRELIHQSLWSEPSIQHNKGKQLSNDAKPLNSERCTLI